MNETKAMDSASPLVTIGIPTYNRADGFLKQALRSALDQTHPELEIVVADNCSADHTDRLVAGFGDPRIRYFKHSHNIGSNNNFNFCLDQARGTYFLLLHDDDRIDPDFVATCIAAIGRDREPGIIRTGTRIIDQTGQVKRSLENRATGTTADELFRAWFNKKTALYLCSTLFHTAHLRELGGFRSKKNLFQDVVAAFRLAARFGRIDIPAVKASYRKHGETITFAARVGDWCEDSLMLLEVMCELAADKEGIRAEGRRYLARTNYRRAGLIGATRERLAACRTVYRMFDGAALPPLKLLLPKKPFTTFRADAGNSGVAHSVQWTEEPRGK